MRAMWIGTETARHLGLGNDFFDLKDGYVTPPGAAFLRNAESLYGLWFVSLQYYPIAMVGEARLDSVGLGEPDKHGLRSFQGRAAHGALKVSKEWMIVVLCTILEAYMKGILEFVATRDPSIMGRCSSEIALGTDEITLANSLEDLKPTITRRWAKAWLEGRREPKAWIKGFKRMGVVGFVNALADRMEDMLGTRHLMVHSAGIVDEAYLQRRPNCQISLGEQLSLSEDVLRDYIAATFDFFAPVEAHFVKEYLSTSKRA
jgi:hypothetical protein